MEEIISRRIEPILNRLSKLEKTGQEVLESIDKATMLVLDAVPEVILWENEVR